MELAKKFLKLVLFSMTVFVLAIFPYQASKAFFGIGEEGFDELIMKLWTYNFYTDYVRTTLEGDSKKIIKGLVAKDGEDIRFDTDMRESESEDEGDPISEIMLWTGMIYLPAQEKSIILYHVPEKFMVMKPEKGATPGGDIFHHEGTAKKHVPPKVEKIKIGEDKHDNHPCDVYKIIVTWQDGKKREGKGWQAQDFESKPWVRLEVYYPEENPDRTETIELYNLKIGKPARSLFSPPPPYKEIKVMTELFGSITGGMFSE